MLEHGCFARILLACMASRQHTLQMQGPVRASPVDVTVHCKAAVKAFVSKLRPLPLRFHFLGGGGRTAALVTQLPFSSFWVACTLMRRTKCHRQNRSCRRLWWDRRPGGLPDFEVGFKLHSSWRCRVSSTCSSQTRHH